MWYTINRMMFWYGIIYVPLLFVLDKRTLNLSITKRRSIGVILFFLFSLPLLISLAIPIENAFFSFPSPQAVVTYRQSGKVMDTLHGEHSCFVIYEPNHKQAANVEMKRGQYAPPAEWYSNMVVATSSRGYKLPDLRSHVTQKTWCRVDRYDRSFDVYYITDTNDYFLYGTTELIDNMFEIVYAYANSLEDLKNNIKTIKVTLKLGEYPTWEFS